MPEKYPNAKHFKRELDGDRLESRYLFLGEEEFFKEEAWRALLNRLVPPRGRRLNGEKLLEYDIGTDRWQAHVKTSKFFPTAYGQGTWGKAGRGHIGLQDYGGAIEYRNIRLRSL